MAAFQFLKNLFGTGGAAQAAEMPENSTFHPSPQFDNLPGPLFKKALEADPQAVLLDVRTPMEVKMGALPGAQNLDFMGHNFAQKVAALDKSKTYFVYCRSGNRSAQACKLMYQMGFDVRNLLGGIGAYG
jgi:rhodanese-related sulfurtransferase